MLKNWYDYSDLERFTEVYSKVSLDEFWSWWSDDDKDSVMEIRIKNYDMLKEYSMKNKIHMSLSGLYIFNAKQLKHVVDTFRDKATIWFGINPKRMLKNKFGIYSFSGRDINISKVKFLFLDIDRVLKQGPASNEELMNADFLANEILAQLSKEGFANDYCKICSGNGIQLLIKLDVPIEIPIPIFNESLNDYIEDSVLAYIKNMLPKGIGKILPSFAGQFKEQLNVEVDKSCFNIGRVGALPYSLNTKYEIPLNRGIVELKNLGKNIGLSDYLRDIFLKKEERVKIKKSYMTKHSSEISQQYKAMKNELEVNVILNILNKYTFPEGGINNTLWYGVKLLLHDRGIDKTDAQYKQMHQQLKALHNRDFSENGLDTKYKNNYNGPFKEGDVLMVPFMINKYLRLHKVIRMSDFKKGFLKPIFTISPKGKMLEKIQIQITPELLRNKPLKEYKLLKEKEDPLHDVIDAAEKVRNLREEYYQTTPRDSDIGVILLRRKLLETIVSFLHSFKDKWGNEVTAYMMKYYMNDYFNFKRW